MAYLTYGFLLVISGIAILTGDGGPPSGKWSFGFGDYKNYAGAAFIYVGGLLLWTGWRKLKEDE
jgi:hypothetical protein